MVRLLWHVEDGLGAFITQNGTVINPDNGVTHATAEIELAGQTITLEACFSLPPNYLRDGSTRDVGVVLAHGSQASTWKGKTMAQLATSLAAAGYLTVRYYCPGKEQRRLRIFEKTLDAAATSPFARGVSRWVIGGIGSGGRVAANVGGKCRLNNIAAYAFLGYPLMEPHNVFKGPTAPDSINHLTKLNAPILFIQPDRDPLGSVEGVVGVLDRMPSWDVRMVEVQGTDGAFRSPDAPHPLPDTRTKLVNTMLEFVSCLQDFRLPTCTSLPRIKSMPTPPQHHEVERCWKAAQEQRLRIIKQQLQQEVQMQIDRDKRAGSVPAPGQPSSAASQGSEQAAQQPCCKVDAVSLQPPVSSSSGAPTAGPDRVAQQATGQGTLPAAAAAAAAAATAGQQEEQADGDQEANKRQRTA